MEWDIWHYQVSVSLMSRTLPKLNRLRSSLWQMGRVTMALSWTDCAQGWALWRLRMARSTFIRTKRVKRKLTNSFVHFQIRGRIHAGLVPWSWHILAGRWYEIRGRISGRSHLGSWIGDIQRSITWFSAQRGIFPGLPTNQEETVPGGGAAGTESCSHGSSTVWCAKNVNVHFPVVSNGKKNWIKLLLI